MKKILIKTGNGKIVVVDRKAYIKALEFSNADVVNVDGRHLIASSAELYENGPKPIETVNNSITENALVVATVSDNPLFPQLIPVVGDSLDIDIKKTNTGAVTITHLGIPFPLGLKKDGLDLAAGELEAGSTIRVIRTVAGYSLATDATIEAAKQTATKIEVATKANGSGINASFVVGAVTYTFENGVMTSFI